MKRRLENMTVSRLKRSSFVQQSKKLGREHLQDMPKDNLPLSPASLPTPWEADHNGEPVINMSVKHITSRDAQSDTSKQALTLAMIADQYSSESWIHIFTDGSATNAIKDGGAGVLIKYPTGEIDTASTATGNHCTNYSAEVQALKLAATMVNSSNSDCQQMSFFTDAMSVLQALSANRETDLYKKLQEVSRNRRVALQWVPAHCGIQGNERADQLAKAGAQLEQPQSKLSYQEKKTIIKTRMKTRAERDDYHLLGRQHQVILLRLRSGHNRLNYHLATKLKLVPSPLCPCGQEDQTAEHILQRCHRFDTLRQAIWPEDTPLQRKLYGSQGELIRTAEFILQTGLSM